MVVNYLCNEYGFSVLKMASRFVNVCIRLYAFRKNMTKKRG